MVSYYLIIALVCMIAVRESAGLCSGRFEISSNYTLNSSDLIVNETNENLLHVCATKCLGDYRCVSANYAESNKLCQLLTVIEEGENKALTSDDQWTHIKLLRWPESSFRNRTIIPTLTEKTRGFISFGYSSLMDTYNRTSSTDNVTIQNWNSLTFTNVNLARYETTVEPTTAPTAATVPTTVPTTNPTVNESSSDAQQPDIYSFLYRESNTTDAEISWKFDFSDTLLRVFKLVMKGTEYDGGGSITHTVCDEDAYCIQGFGVNVETSEFDGAKSLTISLNMSGDPDQYQRLFPVSIYEPQDTFGFSVNITLTDECQ
ncbi:uncharacterized protein [Antedon mediterranea]|uniref:uncharacterized protein n=1 Tax=Antedon mediterranea TaxID=105859 RepID=UPI003AF44CDF